MVLMHGSLSLWWWDFAGSTLTLYAWSTFYAVHIPHWFIPANILTWDYQSIQIRAAAKCQKYTYTKLACFPIPELSLSPGRTIVSLKQNRERASWLYLCNYAPVHDGIRSKHHMALVHKLWWLQHPRGRGSSRPAIFLRVLLLVNHHWEAKDYFVFHGSGVNVKTACILSLEIFHSCTWPQCNKHTSRCRPKTDAHWKLTDA